MSTPEPKPVLSKIDVAKRQLDTAIWLWFNEGDIVSIHLLAGSAFGVIADLFHHRKKERPYPFSHPPEGVSKRDWINFLKASEDFSKHARKDPEGVHEYNAVKTRNYMYHACVALAFLLPGDYDAQGLRFLFVLHCGLEAGSVTKGFYLSGERLDVEELKYWKPSKLLKECGGKFKTRPPRGSDYP